jgi:hypothetical protein
MTVESTAVPALAERTSARIAWWLLTAITALFAINHAVGAFVFAVSTTESLMFMAFAALQILALFVLFIPYRRSEPWAWAASWVSIIAIGLVIAFGADAIALFYVGAAAVMAAAQFFTLPAFREGG